jgi:hypothetical protein
MSNKLYYDSLDEANEDIERLTHVQSGFTFAKCRLGGAMLSMAQRHGIHPCEICPVTNRLRPSMCGGKERTYKDIHPDFFEAARKNIDGGAGGARLISGGGEKRAQRIATIAALERMTR